jgi:hypothetical protein
VGVVLPVTAIAVDQMFHWNNEGTAMETATWNSLEVTKLVVGALVPVSVAMLGFLLTRVMKQIEASQWLNQKLIEKRIELLGQLFPDLNDLYCYFDWGGWKELSPSEIILRKRKLDRRIYANHPFFSTDMIQEYEAFIKALFKTFYAPGADAPLRTSIRSKDGDRGRSYPKQWSMSWANLFVADEADQTDRETTKDGWKALMNCCRTEVGGRQR